MKPSFKTQNISFVKDQRNKKESKHNFLKTMRPTLDAASSSSSELPSSASLHEGEVSGLEVLGLEYGVKSAGELEEDAEGWVQLYCLNELGAGAPQGEMLHEKISENGKHVRDEE